MSHESKKIKKFSDLEAWKKSHKLAIQVYQATRTLPNEERFGLTSQLRRAVVSITSNIEEGFSRNSYKEKVQFYSIALGSLYEIQSQLLIARDIGYLSKNSFDECSKQSIVASKLINGLIKKSRELSLDS